MRLFSLCCIASIVAGCSAPIQSLPGRVVEASVVVEPGKLQLIDWAGARRIAGADGVAFEPVPQSSPKPTSDEIATANAILERNREYTEYVQRPGVLKRAQQRAIPQVEQWLVRTPAETFVAKGRNYPVLNERAGPNLQLTLFPKGAIVSPRSNAERSTGQTLGVAIAAGLAGGQRQLMRYVGGYELQDAATGRVMSSGELDSRLTFDPSLGVSDPYERIFAIMIWDDIMRENASAIRTRRKIAATPHKTGNTRPNAQTQGNTDRPAIVQQTAQASPPVPGSPPLFEGTSYALFTPAQIEAYCQQSWRTRVTPDGRTEYNPCSERSAFGR